MKEPWGNDSGIQSRRRVQAQGYRPKGNRKGSHVLTTVGFDPDVFAEIRAVAVSGDITVSEAIRTLVQWGLDEMKKP